MCSQHSFTYNNFLYLKQSPSPNLVSYTIFLPLPFPLFIANAININSIIIIHSYHHTLLELLGHQHKPVAPEVFLGGFHGYSIHLGQEILSLTINKGEENIFSYNYSFGKNERRVRNVDNTNLQGFYLVLEAERQKRVSKSSFQHAAIPHTRPKKSCDFI